MEDLKKIEIGISKPRKNPGSVKENSAIVCFDPAYSHDTPVLDFEHDSPTFYLIQAVAAGLKTSTNQYTGMIKYFSPFFIDVN